MEEYEANIKKKEKIQKLNFREPRYKRKNQKISITEVDESGTNKDQKQAQKLNKSIPDLDMKREISLSNQNISKSK